MRRIKKAPVIVMNFSGAYKMEQFAGNPDFIHIDCSDIQGTDCILSKDAYKQIKARISNYDARGIHFIDSGNYHYMTRLWTDKITLPFSLLLVDHHTDMQPSLMPGVLTCGDWVNGVVKENKNLKEVLVIGTPREALKEIPEDVKPKIRYVDHEEFDRIVAGKHELSQGQNVYLSIDKDALNHESAITNWDQGDIRLSELHDLVSQLLNQENVIGIDVCGEFPTMKSLFDEEKAASIDNQANEAILKAVVESQDRR